MREVQKLNEDGSIRSLNCQDIGNLNLDDKFYFLGMGNLTFTVIENEDFHPEVIGTTSGGHVYLAKGCQCKNPKHHFYYAVLDAKDLKHTYGRACSKCLGIL